MEEIMVENNGRRGSYVKFKLRTYYNLNYEHGNFF